MLKITKIDFIRHNPWGTSDYCTHYYFNGKRVRNNVYARFDPKKWGYVYDHTKERTVVKNGITRDYTEMYYKEIDQKEEE